MKRHWKRTLSVVLSIAMLFSMTGMNTVFAVEGTPPGASGLCEHHSEHTADCGYTVGTPEVPCAHEHGDECYKEVTKCVHEHTDDCYDDAEETASDSNAGEPANCSHICDEDGGCITKALDCQHEHDEDCDYSPAVPGTPCAFVCEECSDKDSGQQPPPPVDNVLFAITKQPADQTAAEGEAVFFSLAASGEGLSYQWQTASMLEDNSAFTRADIADPAALTWSDVEGADEASYTFDVTLADLYENFYRCVVADGTGQMLTSQIVTVSETKNPLTKAGWGGGTLTPESHIFVPAVAGYGEQTAQVFTVTNGNFAAVDNLTATLGDNSDFEITADLSSTTLAPDTSATVSVRPRTGLAAGTYTDTLTVASTDGGTTKTSSLSFTVHDVSSSVNVATAAELKVALRADDSPFTINVTESIALTEQGTIALGASHILNVASGKTITIDGDTMINVGAHSLTIKGAGKENSTLVCNKTQGYALYSNNSSGKLILNNITVNVIGGNGISTYNTEIASGARLVLNSPDKSNLVKCSQSLAVSGEIDIQAFFATAIVIESGAMTIKSGGTVKVGEGSAGGGNRGIEVYSHHVLVVESGGTLTSGARAGGIALNNGSEVAGMAGKLVDRGQTLEEDGQVTVAQSGAASTDGLTAGTYVWNGTAFEKADIASIEVSAGGQTENFSVAKGGTLQLTATVKDAAGAEVAEGLRGVTWGLLAIPGVSYATGTNISGSGLLTVAADETAASISVLTYSIKNRAVEKTFFVSVIDGGPAAVTTAGELKTELEKTTAQTINVTANIGGLGDSITVGASHTLNIADGKTVTTRGGYDCQFQIPDGKTLTLAGTGTLKANNQTNTGISVEGTLKLTAGSKLVAANSGDYSTGVGLGLSGTPGALVSEGGQITLQNSGNTSNGIAGGTSNDVVTLIGGSLMVENTSGYGINVARLAVTNRCAVTVENTGTSDYGILADTTSFADSTLHIANTVGTGLEAQTLTVTGGTATVANTAGMGVNIYYYQDDGLFTLKNSALTLENTGGAGIRMEASDKLHIDNSTVNCGAGGSTGIIFNDGAQTQLTGANGGKLTLAAGVKLSSVANRFSDRGVVYTGYGNVTVEAESGPPSVERLTAGEYVWDGSSLFAKGAAPTTVTGVSVSPATANVQKGMTQQFGASVQGTNHPAQTVTWAVSGNAKIGTSISGGGLLTVADDETASTLTVTATSTVDGTKSGVATVTVTSLPVTKYSLTVTSGTGTGEYEAGASITVTANAPQTGKQFKEWSATGLTDSAYPTNPLTFQMPAGAVTLTAVYEDISVDTTAIDTAITAANAAKTGITTSDSAASSVANGTKFVTTAEMKALNDAISTAQAAKGTVTTTAQAQAAARTLDAATAVFKAAIKTGTYTSGSTGGGGGGGSSNNGSSSGGNTGSNNNQSNSPATGNTEVAATVKDGAASATVPEKNVTDAIKAAQDAAKKAGTEKNGISVVIDVKTDNTASSLSTTLPVSAVDALIKANVTNVTIQSATANVTLDLAALKAAQATAGGEITVAVAKQNVSGLSAAAQKAIGNRPVFSFTLLSGGKPVTNFGGGTASLSIPYTPQKGEDTGKLCVVYVDDQGGVTYLTNSSYDQNTKSMLVKTEHFSVYGVGYKADAPNFTDTIGHWAKNDIDFVAARGLLSGTGNNQFSPNTSMTRGMFVTALGRLAGINSDSYKTGKFTDVKADAYYAPYVNWAAEKGITGGTTATTFSPDSTVTRQEMAVFMQNYAKAMGYTIPKARAAVTFADNGSIAIWAAEAVKAMQMAGVINGKDGNRFDPTGMATRAEVAATLHRYVELVIDPATAQGWTQNDAGQWLYYENGKPVTGWKLVDGKWYYLDTAGLMQYGGWKQIGGKWYYLYADGSMAVSTKIDGYEIGPDGTRKES